MSLDAAFRAAGQNIGLNEREQGAALQEYMRNGGVNLDPAVTAWCAAYVNASLKQAGVEGTGKLNARSFLEWGQPTDAPQRGDIAVFSRGDPNGWQGHVGFFDGFNPDGTIRVLGGNQGDAVSIASYSPDRLLGYRTMGGTDVPDANALAPPWLEYAGQQGPQGQPQDPRNALAPPEEPQLRMVDTRQDPSAFFRQGNALAMAPIMYERRNSLGSLT